MLRKGDFVEIQALAKAGVYQKDIAAKLSPRRKTVPRTATYGSAHWSVCELRNHFGYNRDPAVMLEISPTRRVAVGHHGPR